MIMWSSFQFGIPPMPARLSEAEARKYGFIKNEHQKTSDPEKIHFDTSWYAPFKAKLDARDKRRREAEMQIDEVEPEKKWWHFPLFRRRKNI